MNHVIMTNHMISLITSSTTDSRAAQRVQGGGCGEQSLDGALSIYNTESLTDEHSGSRIWRIPRPLYDKYLFNRFVKK